MKCAQAIGRQLEPRGAGPLPNGRWLRLGRSLIGWRPRPGAGFVCEGRGAGGGLLSARLWPSAGSAASVSSCSASAGRPPPGERSPGGCPSLIPSFHPVGPWLSGARPADGAFPLSLSPPSGGISIRS